jgi:hypothetical protein
LLNNNDNFEKMRLRDFDSESTDAETSIRASVNRSDILSKKNDFEASLLGMGSRKHTEKKKYYQD